MSVRCDATRFARAACSPTLLIARLCSIVASLRVDASYCERALEVRVEPVDLPEHRLRLRALRVDSGVANSNAGYDNAATRAMTRTSACRLNIRS